MNKFHYCKLQEWSLKNDSIEASKKLRLTAGGSGLRNNFKFRSMVPLSSEYVVINIYIVCCSINGLNKRKTGDVSLCVELLGIRILYIYFIILWFILYQERAPFIYFEVGPIEVWYLRYICFVETLCGIISGLLQDHLVNFFLIWSLCSKINGDRFLKCFV